MTVLFRPKTPMRARLLGRLNRVFDRDPHPVLALRVRSPLGLRWRVRRRVLTIRRPSLPDLALELEGRTVRELRDALAAAGVEIAYHGPTEVLDLGAMALMEGEGDQDASNGDWLLAYTTIVWAWADAVGRWLDAARDDIPLALRQMFVPTSEGEWSELWASYFGLARKPGESDARLNFRTAYEWRRPRSNPIAIQKNIRLLLEKRVAVREPWKEMFLLSVSEMSGGHHFPDGEEFCYHTAQLTSADFLRWEEVMAEAEADRPAGTIFLPPVTIAPPRIIRLENPPPRIESSRTDTAAWVVQDIDGMVLSVNAGLSDSWVLPAPRLFRSDFSSLTAGPLPDPPRESFRSVSICKGEIVLSDGPAIGDLQAHFPGALLVPVGGGMGMSDGAGGGLSDYEERLEWAPVDEWFEAAGGGATAAPEYPPQGPIHRTRTASGAMDASSGRAIGGGSIATAFGAVLARVPERIASVRTDEPKRLSVAGAASASPSAAASLTTRARFAGAASAAPSAAADLATGVRLAGSASAAPSAGAGLATASGAPQPAKVQSVGGSTPNGSSLNINLPGAVAGNKLIVLTAAWQGERGEADSTPYAVTAGSATGAWAKDAVGGFAGTGGTGGQQVSIWSADITQTGAATVSILFPAGHYCQALAVEFSGVASGAAALDRTASRAGDSSTDPTPDAGPTAATTQAVELVVAALGISGGQSNCGIDAATPGYTNLGVDQDSSAVCAFSFDFKVVASTGAQSAAWGTLAPDAGAHSTAIATYKAAA